MDQIGMWTRQTNSNIINVNDFARICHELLRTDNDVTIGIGGFTGKGKSRLGSAIAHQYSMISNAYWGYDRMTWDREELDKWINGQGPDHVGQLPEFSVIVPDELILLFYRRKWYDDEQIEGISTLNTCRDRHLLIIGSIPKFWSADTGYTDRTRFYIFVYRRGEAWVFQQEENPFSDDPWNKTLNQKLFRKHKIEKSPNFIGILKFDDWSPEEKAEYYEIRNKKRIESLEKIRSKNKNNIKNKYKSLIEDRNKLIIEALQRSRDIKKLVKNISDFELAKQIKARLMNNTQIADMLGMDHSAISIIEKRNVNDDDD
jgi:hypothetical protein